MVSEPIVAIVGRPNVGKSTLFNRLLRRRVAIEDDTPGVTRDRIAAPLEWNGRRFTLIDTGGLMTRAQEEMDALVSAAAEEAARQADVLVFVVDGKVGPADQDSEIAHRLLRLGTPVLLAVTKMDNVERMPEAAEYWSLGLGEPLPVSGLSGLNSGDLLDRVVDLLPPAAGEEAEAEGEIRLAVIGRPNVGKSSLVNRLIGEERQIVSERPGTTRDAVDHTLHYMGRTIRLIDTAGLRRKQDVRRDALEYYTMLRTIRAIDRCDTAAVLLDAPEGLTQYDRRLLDDVRQQGKGLIAVVNKWDLVPKESSTMTQFEREFRLQLPDLEFVPLLFTSALTGRRARGLLDLALRVNEERNRRISTAKLNAHIQKVIERQPPPAVKGRWLRIKYVSQVGTAPPRFAFFLNEPKLVPESYRRFLERSLREEYGFLGSPIRVVFRKK